MSEKLRLFFAIPAPPAVVDLAARAQARLRGLRAALPALEGLHLTLAFLGDQDPSVLEPLSQAAARAAAGRAPFALRTAGLGGFPRLSAPRVLYLAFEPQPALDALATALRQQLAVQRISFDPKPLKAHLTLARLREPPDLTREPAPGPDLTFPVDRFELYRSHLTPHGSIYERLSVQGLLG